MAETKNPIVELVNQARETLASEIQAQAEQLQKLEQGVQELRNRHQQLEASVQSSLDNLAKVEIPAPPPPAPPASPMLEQVLAGVRDLITATLPEQVLEVLTEESGKLGVRAAIFDVRGKAAWGSSVRGFAGLTDKVFRGVVVQLSQDTPFRTCYETAGHVDATAATLKKNRNVLEKLKPGTSDPILLLPIRSAGSVSAIFYADAGGTGQPLPVEALKILSEFAGAQLDRLMAFSGGLAAPSEIPTAEPETTEEPVEVQPLEAEPAVAEAAESAPLIVSPPLQESEVEEVPVLGDTVPVDAAASVPSMGAVEVAPPPPPVTPVPPPSAMGGFDLSKLSEEEQKAHRDAKRFAKLLVSEIELYNKAKVGDGRKSGDLYKRLKSDIDRSRQTYEKRFGKTVGKQLDYFHEEVVRILAGTDSALLGPEYPGPTV